MRLVFGWMVGCILFVTGVAHAGPPALPPNPSESAETSESSEPEYDDYRLTLLLSDLSAVSLLIGTAAVSENETIATGFVVAGLGTYALGGPIIHFAHRQPGRGFTSLGLRVGLPGAGILIGVGLAASCAGESGETAGWCVVGAVIFGGVVAVGGALTAMIIDDSILGRAPKNPPRDTARRTSTFRAGLAPLFDPRKKALGISLVGDF
jgi:hypothetical protein